MRTILSFVILIWLSVPVGASAPDLPHVLPGMRTPGFWIGRLPQPDDAVMGPGDINRFNEGLRHKGLVRDLTAVARVLPGGAVMDEISALALPLEERRLFTRDGSLAGKDFFAPLNKNLALELVRARSLVRYGITVRFAHQRLLPTDEPLSTRPGDKDFDELQNSGLDLATPVVVLHQSADGRWLFVHDGISAGWVKASDIALLTHRDWLGIVDLGDRVVITAARAHIYRDHHLDQPVAEVRMGAHFLVRRWGQGWLQILYPWRGANGRALFARGFLRAEDFVHGYLPYTGRNVITQAFKLLDAPYGWGDMHGDQDCSRFIRMVFAVFGFDLPRNSGEQAQAGVRIGRFDQGSPGLDKVAALFEKGVPGLTLLPMKGHITLYLGMLNNRIYAIHAASAYRIKGPEGDIAVPLMRVVVSDFSLGEGTAKGSLLDRLASARLIARP